MKPRIFLLLSLLFAILQGPFLPAVFSEGILLVLLAVYNPPRKFLPVVVFGGLLFDLLQDQTLGVTSLIFVSASGLLFLISKEVSLTNSVLLGVFATIINLVRAKILFGILFLPFALAAGVVTALIFRFIWHPAEEG
jgi:hypothetical protein